MIAADIWVRRKDRLKRIHQPRARRDCLGELVQIDGSEHWWFEDRGPQCTLLVYVDDATSRLMHLKFVETESTFDYFQATREYLKAHGKPVAFYSDKHGVFRVNSTGAVEGDGMTQFGRSLHALNIDVLCANTPQAKGRVERANKTLQDRLVRELRLRSIGTIAAGNELLSEFLADYNARFGKEPRNTKNLHRPLAVGEDLTDIFAWREERTVSNSLTLQYDKVVFLLEPNEITRELRRKGKAAVRLMTKSVAVQHAKDKIRANSVHPGIMPPMRTSGRTADPSVRAERMRVIPMRRPGEVDEVAYAILFLASDESSYITGSEIHVDGGAIAI